MSTTLAALPVTDSAVAVFLLFPSSTVRLAKRCPMSALSRPHSRDIFCVRSLFMQKFFASGGAEIHWSLISLCDGSCISYKLWCNFFKIFIPTAIFISPFFQSIRKPKSRNAQFPVCSDSFFWLIDHVGGKLITKVTLWARTTSELKKMIGKSFVKEQPSEAVRFDCSQCRTNIARKSCFWRFPWVAYLRATALHSDKCAILLVVLLILMFINFLVEYFFFNPAV